MSLFCLETRAVGGAHRGPQGTLHTVSQLCHHPYCVAEFSEAQRFLSWPETDLSHGPRLLGPYCLRTGAQEDFLEEVTCELAVCED